MGKVLSLARARVGWAAAGVVVFLLAGACLRLAWGRDIEYKDDEQGFFEESRRVQSLADLSWNGQTASVGTPAPGMSVWALVGLGKLFAAADPPALARAVQCCNIAALGLLVWFAVRFVPAAEREAWLWAAALAAVNPFTVLLHRKIWNPSVLPLLTVILLCAWQRRDRRAGAFLWGLVGPCMGQIHGSGFFFAGGFALWALLFDRRRVAWRPWLAGSCLGALPLVPWVWGLMLQPPGRAPLHADSWVHVFELKVWLNWAAQGLGFGYGYNLGRAQLLELLSGPTVLGRPTYLVAALHGALLVCAAVLAVKGVALAWRRLASGRRGPAGAPHRPAHAGRSPTAFTFNAAFWGFGLLQTLSCFPFQHHYLVILFPLEFLGLTRLALGRADPAAPPRPRARALLAVLWAAQLLITVSLLHYIHVHPQTGGEYGVPYAAQPALASAAGR